MTTTSSNLIALAFSLGAFAAASLAADAVPVPSPLVPPEGTEAVPTPLVPPEGTELLAPAEEARAAARWNAFKEHLESQGRKDLLPEEAGGAKAPTLTGLAGAFLPRSVSLELRDMQVIADECYLRYRIAAR